MKRTFKSVLVVILASSLSAAPVFSAAGELSQADKLVSRIERAAGQKQGQQSAAAAELWKYAEETPDKAFKELRVALLDRGYTENQIQRVLELQPRFQAAMAVRDPQNRSNALKPIMKDIARLLPAETGSMSGVCWPFLIPAAAGTALLIAGMAKDNSGLVAGGLVALAAGLVVVRGWGCG